MSKASEAWGPNFAAFLDAEARGLDIEVAFPRVVPAGASPTHTTSHPSSTTGPTERDRIYAIQAERMPGFAQYQEKTTRVIPVVELRRA